MLLVALSVSALHCSEDTVPPTDNSSQRDAAETEDARVNGDDASASTDAEVQSDASVSVDSSIFADASATDSGETTFDASEPLDSGAAVRDVGVIADAGAVRDGGTSNTCMTDQDCAPSGWCRPTASGGSVCVPWQSEGGSCGGFVLPSTRERCEPMLSCVGRDPRIPDITGVCSVAAAYSDLDSFTSTYNGRVVAITDDQMPGFFGYVSYGIAACTRRGCPMTDPCCNACTATQIVASSTTSRNGFELISPNRMTYTCGGDECTDAANNRVAYSKNCDLTPGRYRLIGRINASARQFQAVVEPVMGF
ncbi:MAG: hypothetical protein VYC39_15750 [Myxococcota bacterium]|nr:hypothetical protein [Myxococcota bacterium]